MKDLAAKVTASKKTAASKKPASKKPATKKETAKKPAAKVQVTGFAHGHKGQTYTAAIAADKALFRGYTIAAFVHSGLLAIEGEGVKAIKGGSMALWRSLVGQSASNYWKKNRRVNDDGLTAAGLDVCNASLHGQAKGFNTSLSIVQGFMKGMKKGGETQIKTAPDSETAVTLARPV